LGFNINFVSVALFEPQQGIKPDPRLPINHKPHKQTMAFTSKFRVVCVAGDSYFFLCNVGYEIIKNRYTGSSFQNMVF
jgi:hypothetical protein